MKNAGIELVACLPTDEDLPDCVFVEDTAIVIGDTVLITCPGAVSRRAETKEIEKHFLETHMKVVCMEAPAHVDGGDVLFTGREIFVGLSNRSNKEGVEEIKK